jgi:hypothetical protein
MTQMIRDRLTHELPLSGYGAINNIPPDTLVHVIYYLDMEGNGASRSRHTKRNRRSDANRFRHWEIPTDQHGACACRIIRRLLNE